MLTEVLIDQSSFGSFDCDVVVDVVVVVVLVVAVLLLLVIVKGSVTAPLRDCEKTQVMRPLEKRSLRREKERKRKR